MASGVESRRSSFRSEWDQVRRTNAARRVRARRGGAGPEKRLVELHADGRDVDERARPALGVDVEPELAEQVDGRRDGVGDAAAELDGQRDAAVAPAAVDPEQVALLLDRRRHVHAGVEVAEAEA